MKKTHYTKGYLVSWPDHNQCEHSSEYQRTSGHVQKQNTLLALGACSAEYLLYVCSESH